MSVELYTIVDEGLKRLTKKKQIWKGFLIFGETALNIRSENLAK